MLNLFRFERMKVRFGSEFFGVLELLNMRIIIKEIREMNMDELCDKKNKLMEYCSCKTAEVNTLLL